MFEQGYQVVNGVISPQTAELLSMEFQILRDNHYYQNSIPLDVVGWNNDGQVENAFAWFAPYCFESLLLYVKPIMEQVTGKKLHPSYSYARIYYNGATMARHTDRPSCQYSATMTISVDETGPWDIWMRNFNGEAKPLTLNVGDMVVYRGDKLEHWREEPYKGNRQVQCFLHYVDANGEYAHNIYDKRAMLGQPMSNGIER
jgi:hypothetical protein